MFIQLVSNVSDLAGLMSYCIYLNMSQAHEILVLYHYLEMKAKAILLKCKDSLLAYSQYECR